MHVLPKMIWWVLAAAVVWYVYKYYIAKRGGNYDAAVSITSGALSY